MNNKKILLIVSLSGILFLLFLTQISQPRFLKPQEINQKNLEEKIQTQGKIEKVYYSNNKVSIYLKDLDIEIIIFPNSEDFLKLENSLEQNQEIKVTGKIDLYKNNLQIIADKIVLINTK